MAQELAGPIQDCLSRTRAGTDQQSPIFKGCWDWHSSVHAHYALIASHEMSGNRAALNRATQNLTPGNLNAELGYMKRRVTNNRSDNPYGFAWFLRLAIQHERSTGNTSLRPLADYAAAQVAAKLRSNSTTVISTGYNNTGWTALHLAEWAQHTGNGQYKQLTQQVAQQLKNQHCDTNRDAGSGIGGFMPACLMRIAAVATIEGKTATPWVNQQLPQGFNVPVRPNTARGHHNALNFSRAFALARIGNVTGNAALKNNAAELVNWQVSNSRVWKTDFQNNSHWLAQFGVLALQEVTRTGAVVTPTPQKDARPDTPEKPHVTEPQPQRPEPKPHDGQHQKPTPQEPKKPAREKPVQQHTPGDELGDGHATGHDRDDVSTRPGPGNNAGHNAMSGWDRFVSWLKALFGMG